MNSPQAARVRWLLLCIFLLALSAVLIYTHNAATDSADAPAPPSVFLAGPYLNSVGSDRAAIVWLSTSSDLPATVTIQTETFSRQFRPTLKPIPYVRAFLYLVQADGLAPYTSYTYSIRSGDEQLSGNFRTLSSSPEQNFTFALYGDHRTAPDDHRKVADAIAAEKPLFVLSSGDYVTDGRIFDQWAHQFFNPAVQLLLDTPLWPARGNHESQGPLYRALFELPGNELYYSFDCGSATFIILDSNLKNAEHRAQLHWLKNHLTELRLRRPQAWLFVMLHEPIFNIAGNRSHWGHDDVLPLLQEARVDFVLAGHSHLYERICPIRSPNGSVIQHIVSGGGGAPLYSAKPSPLLAHGIGISVHHYCLFTVAPDSVAVLVKQPDGEIIDSFTVARPGPASASPANVVVENLPDKPPASLPPISQQQAFYYQFLPR